MRAERENAVQAVRENWGVRMGMCGQLLRDRPHLGRQLGRLRDYSTTNVTGELRSPFEVSISML